MAIRKGQLFVLVLISGLFGASRSMAVISVQGAIGSEQAQFGAHDPDNLRGLSLELGAHIDPIPLVPVAFGLTLSQTNYTASFDSLGVDKISRLSLTPDVMAWVPLGSFKPYGRLGYSIYNQITGSGTGSVAGETVKTEIDYSATGVIIGLGLEYSILPLIGVTAEYRINTLTMTPNSVKVNGTKYDADSFTSHGSTLLVGVDVGF